MLSEPFFLALLDWIARRCAGAEIEHGRRSAERQEILATLDKHDAALASHNQNVTNALADIRHLLAK